MCADVTDVLSIEQSDQNIHVEQRSHSNAFLSKLTNKLSRDRLAVASRENIKAVLQRRVYLKLRRRVDTPGAKRAQSLLHTCQFLRAQSGESDFDFLKAHSARLRFALS